MKHALTCLFCSLAVSILPFNAGASENIRVLIINEDCASLPAKNTTMEKIGTLTGDMFVMGTEYAGTIDIWKAEGSRCIINELPLEDYVKDVVAAEVAPDWDMEALKVQAVISRTYALYQMRMNSNSLYHIASSVLHQVYKGRSPDARITYAVSQTSGEILTFNNAPIEAFYHSTCGGMTEKSEEVFGRRYPYLTAVESSCNLSPYSSWERTIRVDEIERALKIYGIKGIRIKSFTATKRVKQLSITSRSRTVLVNATTLRKALGWNRLPSTKFTLSLRGEAIRFVGHGYGHGVGLCQWGALQMARDGKDYREILSFFYPGAAIKGYESR